MVERLVVVFATQSGIAIAGVTLSLVQVPNQDAAIALLRWIPAMLLLSGIGVYTTLRSRVASFGIVIAGLMWFAFQLFGDFFLPGKLTFPPFNVIQAALWPLNPYLQPAAVAPVDYWLNRALVAALGIGLIMLSIRQLRDTERVLLGGSARAGVRRDARGGQQSRTVVASPVGTFVHAGPQRRQSAFESQFRQLVGLTAYEVRLQWRRKALLVIAIAILVTVGLFMIVVGGDLTSVSGGKFNPNYATMTPAQAQQIRGFLVVFATWAPVAGVLIAILPFILADTIPLDRQHRVSELLDTLPRSTAIYLGSKVLGAWIASLSYLFAIAVILGIGWRLRIGPYDVFAWLDMWLIGALPLVIVNGGVGVLIAAGQPDRRRAIGVMILVLIAASALTAAISSPLASYLSPLRLPIFNYYLTTAMTGTFKPAEVSTLSGLTSTAFTATIIAGLGEVAALWLIAWAWRRWRPGRV
jgi:hypothetical protein